ncbi:MAG: S8 family peptidase [Ramlibacter sp.]|nr:S8 family peptidase [Ramlibacter sp.]
MNPLSRFLVSTGLTVCSLLCLAGQAWGQTAPLARGLIVQLKAVPAAAGREAPQSARERISAVAQSSGVAMRASRQISGAYHVIQFNQPLQGAALDTLAQRMRYNPDVESVEPDVLIKRQAVPNDPLFASRQWHLQAPAVNKSPLNMPAAWDRSTGTNVTVAVLDTGIRPSHPDLAGKLVPGYDFVSEVEFANDGDGRDADPSDPGDWVTTAESSSGLFAGCTAENSSWHGTFIAGQIGALTNNATGVAGVSWGARVLPVRVSGKCGAFLSDILDGMRWAAGLPVAGVPANANPARIINLSFGGDSPCTASYQNVIDEITAAGSLLVVAAGNEGSVLRRPADCRNVLAVGAVRADGLKVNYSNVGANMALMAPGGDGTLGLHSLDNTGVRGPVIDTYGDKIGTSFSAPLAAGVAALMLSVNPALSPAQIVSRMKQGARPHVSSPFFAQCSSTGTSATCNCTTSACGAGLLDGPGALDAAVSPMVNIAVTGTQQPGATLVLSGAASAAAPGATIQSYLWTQVSGAAVTLQGSNAVTATLVLPAVAGSFSFQLRVTDNLGRASQDTVLVNSSGAVTPPPASSASGGGGAVGWPGLLGLGLLLLAAGLARRAPGVRARWTRRPRTP